MTSIVWNSFRNIIGVKYLNSILPHLLRRNIFKGKMLTATVRIYDGQPYLNISFTYSDSFITKRQFNFRRLADESVDESILRISANIRKQYEKKCKKLKKKADDDKFMGIMIPEIKIIKDGKPIPVNVINSEAWREEHILRIGKTEFNIEVNPPTIKSLKLPSNIMSGFTFYPEVDSEFTELNDSKFVWYKTEEKVDDKNMKLPLKNVKWTPITVSPIYNVTSKDIGHLLKVACYPKNGIRVGTCTETITENAVEAGPGLCPYHSRHLMTKKEVDGDNFRVVSYNLLADYYADSNYSRDYLFSYCPANYLCWDYRRPLLLDEISGYNADIICMQEVDLKAFENDFMRLFKSSGFGGLFHRKGERMPEGLSLFYRQSKFKLISESVVRLGEELKSNVQMSNIFESVSSNEKLAERFINRSTVLTVCELELVSDPSKRILVANTHLHSHQNADHIRLLQGAVCIRYIEQTLNLKRSEFPDHQYGLVFCGDFNSCPDCGIYQLMTTRSVSKEIPDWNSCPGEEVKGLSVSHGLNVASAYGCPNYTNYSVLFNGCLDYIFYETDNLKLIGNVPLPSHEEVTLHQAIPNVVFPSDHLSLVSEFSWKSS